MNSTKLKKTDYIFLSIVFIGFYLLDRFCLSILDDYFYSFIAGVSGGINGELTPVKSIVDALKSNIYDYMHWNGRFIIHTITSYFCGVIGVDAFRIINSIVFILFLIGLIKLIRSEFGTNKTDKYIILFLLFTLMPEPGSIFLGIIAFTTNYLWTSCAIIYFILLYNKINKDIIHYNTIINILLLIVGIITGSLQESFTVGISGALFLYYCYNIKKFKGSVIWLVLGFWIGTCIVTFAPGNFERLALLAGKERFIGPIKYFNQLAHLIFDSKLLIICILSFIILYFKDKNFITIFLKKNKFYILAILLNGIIVTIVYTGKRQLTCIELFSMILLIKIIYSYFFAFCENKSQIINITISIFLMVLYIPIYKDRQINYKECTKLQNMDPKNGVIVNKHLIDHATYIRDRKITANYKAYSSDYLSKDLNHGLSLIKSDGKDMNYITAILPQSPKEIATQFNNKSNLIYNKKYKTYYFRCPRKQFIKEIYIVSEPTKFLGKVRNKLFNKKFNKSSILENTFFFQYSDYNYYAFINIKNYIIHKFEIEYK